MRLLLEESERRNTLNGALVLDLRTAVTLRNWLAGVVTVLTIMQVLTTNAMFAYMLSRYVHTNQLWPSDRLILGWFASTVVEIIGLYAIVLRGVFTPSSLGDAISRAQD